MVASAATTAREIEREVRQLAAGLPYFTLVIPSVPSEVQATEWHPRPEDRGGPFEVLTRGAFASESGAIAWARDHLDGLPYTVRRVGGES